MKHLIIVVVFLVALCNCSVKLPSTWKKCERKDPHFTQCLTKSVENAIKHLNKPLKKLGVPSLEPLHIKNISVEAGSGAVAFHQNLTYLDVHGLTKLHLDKFDIDFNTKTVIMECSFPQLIYEFNFTFVGKAAGFPLNGSGFGRGIMDKSRYVVTFLLDEYVRNGEKHLKVIEAKLALDTKHLKIKLQNMFKDDIELENRINRVFNDNWRIILDQGKGSYEVILGKVFSSIFNNVLRKFSIKELFGK